MDGIIRPAINAPRLHVVINLLLCVKPVILPKRKSIGILYRMLLIINLNTSFISYCNIGVTQIGIRLRLKQLMSDSVVSLFFGIENAHNY